MYAKKNEGVIHLNPEPEKVRKFMNDGYEILDDDMKVISDPVEEAEEEEKEHTMTGTLEDFFNFCKEHKIIV